MSARHHGHDEIIRKRGRITMRIENKPATAKGPDATFTGDVWVDAITAPKDSGQRMVVSRVRFAPGAHTAWHSHACGQTLHVTDGIALMGTRDGTVIEVHPGQTVYTSPGEEHWHGATPEDFMEHLAMLDNADDPAATTTWLEQLGDAEYRRP
jgi:quercetin dioxygenase-like cupin family protein